MTDHPDRFTGADIHDRNGRRKYLTGAERRRFRACSASLEASRRDFCLMLFYTGARISEVLELTPNRLDEGNKSVVIRTLKRRNNRTYRAVPLPDEFLKSVRRYSRKIDGDERLWPFSRKTAYRIVKQVMRAAAIEGVPACPKGLRHGFGVACVEANIPLPTIAKWMGHSSIETTAIYLNVIGKEERGLARRTWK